MNIRCRSFLLAAVFTGLFLLVVGTYAGENKKEISYQLNYVWMKVETIESKSGGLVSLIEGKIINKENEILGVDSLADLIIKIQKRPDGKWYLAKNIFYKPGEISQGMTYKVLYEYTNTAPSGKISISPYGM